MVEAIASIVRLCKEKNLEAVVYLQDGQQGRSTLFSNAKSPEETGLLIGKIIVDLIGKEEAPDNAKAFLDVMTTALLYLVKQGQDPNSEFYKKCLSN